MKLPEPVGWQQVSTGQVWLFKANKDDLALFTETQLREALAQQADQLTYQLQEQNRWLDAKLAQQEDVMRHVLDVLGPQTPECCGCKAEWNEAIKALEDALK